MADGVFLVNIIQLFTSFELLYKIIQIIEFGGVNGNS